MSVNDPVANLKGVVLPSVHSSLPENLPGRFGEHKFASWIAGAADDVTSLWFNVNHLYGVGEIDALISHPSVGFVVVEVKGHSIKQVAGYSADGRKVAFGEVSRKNPALQAHEQAQKLKGWFGPQRPGRRPPWVHSLALWPNIARADWVSRFGPESAASRDSEFMVFTEDLVSFADFIQRVNLIIRNPRFGVTPPSRVFDIDEESLDHFVGLLSQGGDFELPVGPTATAVASAFKFSSSAAKEKSLPEHWRAKRLVVEGPAGSGKTQTLLRIGLEHLAEGRRVLFACYNKTLAAEVRRELTGKTVGSLDSEFLAFDYYELAKFLQPSLRVPYRTANAADGDSFGEYLSAVSETTRVDQLDEFDVVLVDETQDITDEQWKLVQSVCGKETYIAIALGSRQELYREGPSEAVLRWAEKAESSKLKRRFRDAAQGFYVGQAFAHMNFDSGKLDPTESILWMEKQRATKQVSSAKADQLDFGGDDFVGSVIKVSDAPTVQEDVRRLIGKMARHKEPVNALIVVGGKKSPPYRWAVEQLEALDLKYFDLVQTENRRVSPPRSAIRISTAHSARGLEADYVLVLDFNRICEWIGLGHRLSYIALSRARIETVVSRASGAGPYLMALSEIVAAYSRNS